MRELFLRAVASCVVRTAELHPNLRYAAIVDGKLTTQEVRLIREAGAVAGLPPRLERAKSLRRRFLAGEPLEWG